jgi:ribosomal protein RSM22 (predicted rRNA methylase)
MKIGRVGPIGEEELEKAGERLVRKQLRLIAVNELEDVGEAVESVDAIEPRAKEPETNSAEELEGLLRSESYNWPRLVFPPLKRSGHIILDCCTPEGEFLLSLD